jgi:hypothetical protein
VTELIVSLNIYILDQHQSEYERITDDIVRIMMVF